MQRQFLISYYQKYLLLQTLSISSQKINLFLSRYLLAVKLLPQNSVAAKKLIGSLATRKRPIGEG
ncbi:S-layer homology domain-containing protein [Bacillus toyonensis]|nr:S-layer homology domain-containing protein [Bacillus toyonensis]